MPAYKLEGDLQKAVEAFNTSYASSNPSWFGHFAEDATIYRDDDPQPVTGREAYRKEFEKAFTSEKRTVHTIQQDAQMMGDTAVVMQLLEISLPDIVTNVRESAIWHRTPKGWEVSHLNTSIIGGVRAAQSTRTMQAVRVLKDKIALVSSQAGVAQ